MLEQVRIPRGNRGLDQLMPDLSGMQNVQQLRLDINRLVAARYFIIFMGAVLLLSVVAQALFFDGGCFPLSSFQSGFGIASRARPGVGRQRQRGPSAAGTG